MRFFAYKYLLIDTFSNETRHDLYILQQMMLLKTARYGKLLARKFVGSAIKICKVVGQPDLADEFNEIVKGCFTPDEHQDKEDPS
jgi:hypothetical protein